MVERREVKELNISGGRVEVGMFVALRRWEATSVLSVGCVVGVGGGRGGRT